MFPLAVADSGAGMIVDPGEGIDNSAEAIIDTFNQSMPFNLTTVTETVGVGSNSVGTHT